MEIRSITDSFKRQNFSPFDARFAILQQEINPGPGQGCREDKSGQRYARPQPICETKEQKQGFRISFLENLLTEKVYVRGQRKGEVEKKNLIQFQTIELK